MWLTQDNVQPRALAAAPQHDLVSLCEELLNDIPLQLAEATPADSGVVWVDHMTTA